jgi:hypothetical protein
LQLTGIRAGKVGTVLRADGGRQITIGGWPVYRFIGDLTPGQWNGQRLGGVWFVVTKSGKRNLKQNYLCLPGATPTAGSPSSGATLPGGATLPSIPLPGVSAPAPTPSGGY